MKNLYIGGRKKNTNGGMKWKFYFSLFLFLAIGTGILKLTAPTIAEKWINQKGARARGYAFSIRDVGLSLGKGEITFMDVKVFHPQTSAKILEVPTLTLNVDWPELMQSRKKFVKVEADKVELMISRDLAAEIERIQTADLDEAKALYIDAMEGKIGKLNLVEQKEGVTRTVMELADVNFRMKDFTPFSINQKTGFGLKSQVADGGKLDLTGTTKTEEGNTSWDIQGELKEVPADILNKIAGTKLPFSFDEPKLNVEIVAHSEDGKIKGEIAPDIKRLNLLDDRPGVQAHSIARALTDELTFTLPFTLKDELTLQYSETYSRLKNYRKYPQSVVKAEAPKSSSFWTF